MKKILVVLLFCCFGMFAKSNDFIVECCDDDSSEDLPMPDLSVPDKITLHFELQKDPIEDDFSAELVYCSEVLTNLSSVASMRELTFEELMLAMKIIMFLYMSPQPYHKFLKVELDGNIVPIPFSYQLFEQLMHPDSCEEDNELGEGRTPYFFDIDEILNYDQYKKQTKKDQV